MYTFRVFSIYQVSCIVSNLIAYAYPCTLYCIFIALYEEIYRYHKWYRSLSISRTLFQQVTWYQSNFAHQFQLETDIRSVKQDDKSIQEFYNVMNGYCNPFVIMDPQLPCCNCTNFPQLSWEKLSCSILSGSLFNFALWLVDPFFIGLPYHM